MTTPYVLPAPVIVSVTMTTFFGQPGAIITGTEDISNVPSGSSVEIGVFDRSTGTQSVGTTSVNSDGTWQALIKAQQGDMVYALAGLITDGNLGVVSAPSPTVVIP